MPKVLGRGAEFCEGHFLLCMLSNAQAGRQTDSILAMPFPVILSHPSRSSEQILIAQVVIEQNN